MKALVLFFIVTICAASLSFAQGGGGGGSQSVATLQIGDRVAVPGSVIRVKMKIETSVPIRGIDLLLVYPSDTLAARSWFWVNWWEFGGWLVAQNAKPDSDHIAMASRFPFVGSAVLGSFRVRLSSYVAPGIVVPFPRLIASLNDTIVPTLIVGSVIAGPHVMFGDVNQNGALTVGDVVRALDIAIPDPDSGRTVSQVEFLAADVSGDGEIETYDCWQILYKVVFPEYRFDVEDWEKSSVGIGLGSAAPIVIEETSEGVWVKIGKGAYVRNGDFTVHAARTVTLEVQDALRAAFYKTVAGTDDHRVGFVKIEPFAAGEALLFLSGVRADEVEVRGTVNEGIPFIAARVGGVTFVEPPETIPERFALAQNYPNPFNPMTTISFELPRAGFVELKVFDVLGREVATLVKGERSVGTHIAHFNASALPSGIYVYRLQANGTTLSRKMLLMK